MAKVVSLRGGNIITAEDIKAMCRDGIDNEALVILYNSTHDSIQKLLIEELAYVRGVSLIPELILA